MNKTQHTESAVAKAHNGALNHCLRDSVSPLFALSVSFRTDVARSSPSPPGASGGEGWGEEAWPNDIISREIMKTPHRSVHSWSKLLSPPLSSLLRREERESAAKLRTFLGTVQDRLALLEPQLTPTKKRQRTGALQNLAAVRFFCVMCFGLMLFPGALHSQPINISTVAGYAGNAGRDGFATAARFNNPHGLAMDANDNLYVADTENHTIRKITPDGNVSTIAGLSGVSGTNDGPGIVARFFQPKGVAVDGNFIYVADTGNHTIRRITLTGDVTRLAGMPGVSGNANGSGSVARFNGPLGIAVMAGNLYVADYGNGLIRKVTANGTVSTFASVPGPQGLITDGLNLYVADFASSTILKITSGGSVSTLAGSANNYGSSDGTGTNALFYHPAAIAVDSENQLYVADSFNNTIRRVTPSGTAITLAGLVGVSGHIDGSRTSALFFQPQGVAVDSAFNVYVADTGNSTIRKISPAAIISTFAGSPSNGSTDGSRGAARFSLPVGIAGDNFGNLFVVDAQNHIIRKVSPAGDVTTLAGSAGTSGSANGTGANAKFYSPQAIAPDGAGNFYIADTGNSTIRKITSSGTVTTIAGTAGNHGYVNGEGLAAEFFQPQGIAVDTAGNLIVADTMNHVIRKISGNLVTTIAGVAEKFGGTDGTNAGARFKWPTGIALDDAGNIFIADSGNHTLRKISPSGPNWITTTIAGFHGLPGTADGTNNAARFFAPRGIVIDATGNLFVVDSGNHAVRQITVTGTNWVVSTIAGYGGVGGSADGFWTDARFHNPAGIAIDSSGFLYIADSANNTIRVDRIIPPELRLTFYANQAVLSWSALSPGFILEGSIEIGPTASWAPIDAGSISGDSYVLTNGVSIGNVFYRLRQQ